jgi:hypothetical protein
LHFYLTPGGVETIEDESFRILEVVSSPPPRMLATLL